MNKALKLGQVVVVIIATLVATGCTTLGLGEKYPYNPKESDLTDQLIPARCEFNADCPGKRADELATAYSKIRSGFIMDKERGFFSCVIRAYQERVLVPLTQNPSTDQQYRDILLKFANTPMNECKQDVDTHLKEWGGRYDTLLPQAQKTDEQTNKALNEKLKLQQEVPRPVFPVYLLYPGVGRGNFLKAA